MSKFRKKDGSILVISVLILSAILVGAISISLVSVKERKASIGETRSNQAFQKADQGVEELMQIIKNKAGDGDDVVDIANGEISCDAGSGNFKKGTEYEIELRDSSDNKIRCDSSSSVCDISEIVSLGSSSNYKRAIAAPVLSQFCCPASVEVEEESGRIVDYPVVRIGSQCWMAKNLNVGQQIQGNIEQGTDCSSPGSIEKYCYENNPDNCKNDRGGLYQRNQAMCGSNAENSQGICPSGWHIPTDGEWHDLEEYLKDAPSTSCEENRETTWECNSAGAKLKSAGTSDFDAVLTGALWDSPRSFGYGPSATGIEKHSYFWSSTINISDQDFIRVLAWEDAYKDLVYRTPMGKDFGFSVRCIKNKTPICEGILPGNSFIHGTDETEDVPVGTSWSRNVTDNPSVKCEFDCESGYTWNAGACTVSCVPNMGSSCGGSSCVNPGTIQCNGSCLGTSNKPNGTVCGTNMICQNGACISNNCHWVLQSTFCGNGWQAGGGCLTMNGSVCSTSGMTSVCSEGGCPGRPDPPLCGSCPTNPSLNLQYSFLCVCS